MNNWVIVASISNCICYGFTVLSAFTGTVVNVIAYIINIAHTAFHLYWAPVGIVFIRNKVGDDCSDWFYNSALCKYFVL